MARKVKISVGYEGHREPLEVELPDGEPAPWDADSQLRIVGKRVPRLDAVAKVTGAAKYTWDVQPAGMLHGRMLRSPHPSARLISVDVTRARRLPGVKAAWAEKPGRKLLFQGQEVAAVAAITPEIAEDALALVDVKYEPRPFVVDATRAREKDAPPVFESASKAPAPDDDDAPGARTQHTGNVRSTVNHEGDVDAVMAKAEVTVEGTYRTQVQTHSALETHGSVAEWGKDGTLTVWSSTQGTFGVRDQVARALKLPKDKVRVVCEYMGGGFGAKFSAGPWSIVAAKLAREAGAPVQMMLTRKAEHLVAGNRPDSTQWIKLGARRDGTLLAIDLKSYGNCGVGTGAGAGGPVRGLYHLEAWRTDEADVFTNTGAAQPFRAPGHPQGCFALEQAIDELAEKLGMDPVALRKKNLANPLQLGELDRAVDKCAAWRKRGKPGAGSGPIKRGVGLACGLWYKIVNPSTQAQIDVHNDGRIEVSNGAQDIGTGTRTWMATVAAEELGQPLESVSVRLGDTSWPIGPGSGGSTTSQSLAPAVRSAAFQMKQKLAAVAAKMLGARSDDITVENGRFVVVSDKKRGAAWKEVAARIPGEKITVLASRADDTAGFRDRVGGVQIAEVAVDTRTGVVQVERVTVLQDCGRVLNALTAESQINGGVIQGVSYALHERRALDPHTGQMVNANLESYKIATANDCPAIDVVPFEVSNGFNNAGVMGLGEPPTVPTAAAIANAVHNALGVRVRELPITPAQILFALGRVKVTTSSAPPNPGVGVGVKGSR